MIYYDNMKVNPEIFRAYDIRGVVDKDLNPEVAELIGKAFGTYLLERGTKDVLVGRDTRATSKDYQEAISRGLLSTGCNIVDIGVVFASLLYFARQHYKIDGGAFVTASHNPPEWNGFKLCHGLNAIVEEEIKKVGEIMFSGKFRSGRGKIKKLDPAPAYFKALRNKIKLKKSLKIAVNCGNATSSIFITQFLKELGCEVAPLYCDVDSTFSHGMFDPAKLSHYQDLAKRVKKEKADLGVMFDGDSDRVGFVDEKGNPWLGDIILILLIRDIIPKNRGRKVIVEVKDSELVVEETKKWGGVPVFWKTGHALLDHKVFEEKAILCGEMSCHYWITDDWYYFDDGIHAMARILKILSESDKSLSELVGELGIYPATPEKRIDCPDDKKFKLVQELVEYFKDKCDKIIDVDGIRGYLDDGWFLIRASNTEPLLAVRCEAKTEAGLEKIKKFVKDKLDSYSFIHLDWGK